MNMFGVPNYTVNSRAGVAHELRRQPKPGPAGWFHAELARYSPALPRARAARSPQHL
jgi:hypothetical protein